MASLGQYADIAQELVRGGDLSAQTAVVYSNLAVAAAIQNDMNKGTLTSLFGIRERIEDGKAD